MEDPTPAVAERWVAAALAEAAALREYDRYLYPLTDDMAAMERAHRIHDAWKEWIDDTDGVVRRFGGEKGGKRARRNHVPGLHDLRIALMTAKGIVAMTPEELLRRHRRYVGGEAKSYTSEEMRRELGLGHKR